MRGAPSREPPGPRINDAIQAPEVRLIIENGDNIGTVGLEDAQSRANEAGLDLVEVSPDANPTGLQDPRLRKIQIPGTQEGSGGAQAPQNRRGQRDQDASRHRYP